MRHRIVADSLHANGQCEPASPDSFRIKAIPSQRPSAKLAAKKAHKRSPTPQGLSKQAFIKYQKLSKKLSPKAQKTKKLSPNPPKGFKRFSPPFLRRKALRKSQAAFAVPETKSVSVIETESTLPQILSRHEFQSSHHNTADEEKDSQAEKSCQPDPINVKALEDEQDVKHAEEISSSSHLLEKEAQQSNAAIDDDETAKILTDVNIASKTVIEMPKKDSQDYSASLEETTLYKGSLPLENLDLNSSVRPEPSRKTAAAPKLRIEIPGLSSPSGVCKTSDVPKKAIEDPSLIVYSSPDRAYTIPALKIPAPPQRWQVQLCKYNCLRKC